jgi:hypothetical protein
LRLVFSLEGKEEKILAASAFHNLLEQRILAADNAAPKSQESAQFSRTMATRIDDGLPPR